MNKYLQITRTRWFYLVTGLIAGALVILGIRFITYKPDAVHYHANFSVYINGQRELFNSPIYYEETTAASCNLDEHEESPLERAHMHGNVNDVVHIEDHLVTWGNFLQNIGWSVDKELIKTLDKMYLADSANKITFILNGKKVDNINNLVVGDKDRLLIDYGDVSDSGFLKRFNSVANTAHKYNVTRDPASCGAGKGTSIKDKLEHLL